MPKKKLLEDIKKQPSRFYRLPGDVARDRRFVDAERLEILQAWRSGADAPNQVDDAIAEIESRHTSNAAE